MKTNSRRYRRHRNPEITDTKEAPFFSPTQKAIQTKADAFFQPKLAVGQPGDSFEREADSVADKVVNGQAAKGSAVQRKEISSIQAMPEKKEEEKQVQKKGKDDKKEEEKPVQKKDDKAGKDEDNVQLKAAPDKKEEEKQVQKKGKDDKKEEEKPVQKKGMDDKKEEEKPVQKKEEPEKKPAADEVIKEEKEEKEKGKPSLMGKESSSRGMQEGSDQLAQQLKEQRSNGVPLSPDVRNEMGSAIGADFGNVRIHTGDKAAALSNELGAQAFTHGNDVYFNSGKYDADSSTGKHLLAHELTHVVQQGAAPAIDGQATAASAAHSTPGVQREISTPLPEGVEPNKKSKVAKFPIGDFNVVVKPDRKATRADKVPANNAKTNGRINVTFSLKYTKGKQKKIESVTISKKLTIQTIYGKKATSESDSAYGRGHIKADKDAGHGTLGFHEGSHGTDFINYVNTHPFPEIVIETPVTKKEFKELKKQWQQEFKAYVDDMHSTSKTATDDVTDPPAAVTP